MTITDLINAAGGASVVALALGVSRRTVKRWKDQISEIKHSDWERLKKMGDDRMDKSAH